MRWRLAAGGGRRFGSRRLRLGLHAAQDAAHPRQQLPRLERLGDIVVGAHLESDHPVHHVAGRGHHDDADVVALAQEARERDAVLARQADVQQDQVGKVALDLGAHGAAAVDRLHLEAVARQVLDQHRPDIRVVVDDEKAASVLHRRIVRRESAG